MSRLKSFVANLGLTAASILAFLLVCEFVVFRFVLPGSDVPSNAYWNDVVRYAPSQQGTWRVRDEIAAPYAINGQGWNSGVGDYEVRRRPGTMRIAVVGDSYVEALQVRHDRSLAEQLAANLARHGRAVESYRFGISGAPLSQYLHMIEREVAGYRPDWIVVVLIHNDFDESFRFQPGRYTSSFRKLRVENGRVLGEAPPTPWTPGWTEWARRTATARFLLYRWQVRPAALMQLLPTARAEDNPFAANIDLNAILARQPDIAAATDYLFGRLAAAARGMGAKLLLTMDGDRQGIYAGLGDSAPLALNRLAAATAMRHGIPFLDLHPEFTADWRANGRRFEFESDGHWNEHGHAVAGAAVAEAIRKGD